MPILVGKGPEMKERWLFIPNFYAKVKYGEE